MKLLYDTANGIANVGIDHVPSHEGMPWNELTDGLANRARKANEYGHDVDNLPHNFKDIDKTTKYYQWEAMLDDNHRDRHAYPKREGKTLSFGVPARQA